MTNNNQLWRKGNALCPPPYSQKSNLWTKVLSRLLPVLVALFTLSVGNVWGETIYRNLSTSEVINLTSYSVLTDIDANWVIGDGSTAFSNGTTTSGKSTITPKVSGDESLTTAETVTGLKIKDAANKNVTFFVKGITAVYGYISASSTHRIASMTITAQGETAMSPITVDPGANTNKTQVASCTTLDASKSYAIKFAATNDCNFYAIKFIVPSVSVTGVSLNKTATSIEKDATETLTATVAPSNATNKSVTWESSNTGVATVSAAGVVTGVAAGTATITVKTADGNKTAICAVTVTESAATKSAINYAETKGADMSAYPTQYTEGVGVESFAALSDVTDFHFTGWSPTSISASATGAQTITAQWEEVAAARTMFSLEMSSSVSNQNISKDDSPKQLTATEATISGGKAYVGNNNTDASKMQIKNKNLYYNGNDGYLYLDLTEALHEGDVISFTNNQSNTNQIVFTTTSTRATSIITVDGSYTIPAESPLIGASELYVWRNSNGTYVQTLTIKTTAAYAPVPTYSVTYSAGDGTGTMTDANTYKQGKTVTILENAFTAPDGKEFDAWSVKDADNNVITVTDGKFVMPAKAVTITATWKVSVTKYDVTFNMQGHGAAIEKQQVASGETATEPEDPKAVLYKFGGWYTAATCADAEAFDFSTPITAAKELFAKWTEFGVIENIDAVAAATASTDLSTFEATAAAKNLAFANANGMDNTTNNNGAYAGLKFKSASGYFTFYAPENKRVIITLGYMASAAKIYFDGVENTTYTLTGGSTTDGDANFKSYAYDFAAKTLVKVQMQTESTCVLKSIEVIEIPSLSDDASLSNLTLGGEQIEGFTTTKQNYYITLPYGTAANPVAVATANEEHATVSSPIQVSGSLAENNLQYDFHVTAEDASVKYYRINFTVAPKLGAEIIKATITGNSTADASGLYAGSVATSNSSKKLGSNGHYVKFVLAEGKTFASGDTLAFDVTTTSGASKIYITSALSGDDDKRLATIDYAFTVGNNYVALPAAVDGLSEFYLYRVDSKFNPTINSAAVLRTMPSIIKSFKIGEVAGVIDQENKTIAVELPNGTDVTSLTPTVEAYANGGATVSPTTAQDFSSEKTYTVTSAYAEDAAVSYEVTVTVAAPACPTEVTISGTTTYTDGGTIELTAATDATGSYTFQWKKDGAAIEGATYATFTKTATMSDGGDYTCTVSQDGCEAVTSEVKTVTVNKKAVTKVEVSGATRVKFGQTIQLTATVTPADPTYPTVTWTSEGTPVYFTFADANANPATVTGARVGATKNIYAEADGKKSSGFKVTCYAVVIYNTNGGAAIEDAEYDGSSAITLPTPTGGTEPFLGWYTDAEFANKAGNAGASYKPTGNVTLFAKWTLPDAETPVITTDPVGATYNEGETMAELTVVASVTDGGTLSYQWYKGSTEVGMNSASYTPTEAGTYKVVVTNTLAGHNPASATSAEAVIVVNHGPVDLQNVTGTYTWDWSKAGTGDAAIDSYTEGVVLANVSNIVNDANFWSDKLFVIGQWGYRTDNKFFQGTEIHMHTTVPGFMKLSYRCTDKSKNVKITVNGKVLEEKSGDFKESAEFLVDGDVVIKLEGDGGAKLSRVNKIVFTATSYNETVRSGLVNGKIGTMCLSHGVKAYDGGVIYSVLQTNAIGIDLVEAELPLKPGQPYIFQAEKESIRVIYSDAAEASAADNSEANGLVGNLTGTLTVPNWTAEQQTYIFKDNHICRAFDNCYVGAGKAYINKSAVNAPAEAPAPTRRRISMASNDANTATGLDELMSSEKTQKVLIDGNVYIIREGKMFNAVGQLVK